MKKIETVWHHLLYTVLSEGRYRHTQQEIAKYFHLSLSTVNHALRVPVQLGAIRKESKFFILQDCRKLLYYWASVRNFSADLIHAAGTGIPLQEREGLALPSSIYAAYTAARHLLGEPPADYDQVYFYLSPGDLPQFKKRFPHSEKRPADVFALKMPSSMPRYGPDTTPVQTFVDLWNLSDWYARDFIQALEGKIRALLS